MQVKEIPRVGLRDQAERVLTNAEILALPLTGIEILPGIPNFLLDVFAVELLVPALPVVFGAINAAAKIAPKFTGTALAPTVPLDEAAGDVTALLATGAALALLLPAVGPVVTPLVNRAGIGLTLTATNGGVAFTGGSAGQVLQVRVTYAYRGL